MIAFAQLEDVGSELLGQWEEWTGFSYHVRRRLRPEEQELVGPVIDIRGTSEAEKRLAPLRHILPKEWNE